MKKSFFILLLGVGLLAVVIFILPQLPQADLQKRLTAKFEQLLQQPCQIDRVNLQIFPHPAVVVQNFESVTGSLNIKSRALALEFSYISLLRFAPEITGVTLQGTSIKTPFPTLVKPVSAQPANVPEAVSGSKSLVNLIGVVLAPEQNFHYINIQGGNWELTEVPGLDEPLKVTDVVGRWQNSVRNSSEKLELVGAVAGGRGDLDMTWYKVEKPEAGDGGQLHDQAAINRLEVSGHLDAVSLPVYEVVLAASPEKIMRFGFARGFLEFDINGDPEAGLRFTGKFAVDNHKLAIYDVESGFEKRYSQGEAKLSLSGFFQRHDSYINIKSAALELPGAATFFSRGLIRFSEPHFIDLVNELKIDDLKRFSSNIPVLALPGYQVEGQLGGELKLVGNPASAPVLQVKLKADQIVLHKSVSVDPQFETAQADPPNDSTLKPGIQAVQFLKLVAGWNWFLKSDCQIKTLVLPELTITDISLLAEKNLMQLEIERLVAHFGKSGQLRLSLILDNLLQNPHWQASLIARKFNLKPFRKSFSTTGILDASLVGSGSLESDSELFGNLNLNGKWWLRQGTFLDLPLYDAFTDFLKQKIEIQLGSGFTDFSGKFTMRDKVLRLKQVKLRSAGNQVAAGGRFLVDSDSLKFNGNFIAKSSSSTPFKLSGNLQKPLFQ